MLRTLLLVFLFTIGMAFANEQDDTKSSSLINEGDASEILEHLRSDQNLATILQVYSAQQVMLRRQDKRRGVEVRLIGVDAPEPSRRDLVGQEPWGTIALQWLSTWITQKQVKVEYDIVKMDLNRKLLVYLWLDDVLVNEEIIRQGHGFINIEPPNVRYADRLQRAQREARENHRGIWDEQKPLTILPSSFREGLILKQVEENQKIETVLLPQWRAGAIIGNRKTKVFHEPGGRWYESSKASPHAVFFATKDAALAAGFRPASQ